MTPFNREKKMQKHAWHKQKKTKRMLETEENFDRMREINKRKKGDRLQTEKK